MQIWSSRLWVKSILFLPTHRVPNSPKVWIPYSDLLKIHTRICYKIQTQICYVQLKNSVLRKVTNCVFGGLRFHPCPLFWDITTILFDFVIQRSACIIQSSSIWDHFIGFNLTTNPHFTRQRLMKSEFAHFVFIPPFLIFFIFVQQFDICHHLYYRY